MANSPKLYVRVVSVDADNLWRSYLSFGNAYMLSAGFVIYEEAWPASFFSMENNYSQNSS